LSDQHSTSFRIVQTANSELGWVFEVDVLVGSPYFAGHFDGEAVLPGVAQLALLVELYGGSCGAGAALREAPVLRFREKVLPGDVLRAEIGRPDDDGRSRFSFKRRGAMVSQGTVTWGD
jgi:3-hydroxyacyl-[acyl-carrier-protein] dehydratase